MPLTGRPSYIISGLRSQVSKIVGNPRVRTFYVGRTNDMVGTKSRQGADEVVDLYETEVGEDARVVEDELLKTFFTNPKSINDIDHAVGAGGSGTMSYVYIALWY